MVALLVGITLYSGKCVVRRSLIVSLVYCCAGASGFVALACAFGDMGKQHGSGHQSLCGDCQTYPALTISCNLTSRSSRRCFVAAAACMRYASTRCRHYRSAA